MAKKFDLERRTTEFGKAVIRMCKELPRDAINGCLIGQVVGAAGSVGANYREANDALGKKDFNTTDEDSKKRGQGEPSLA